MIQGCYFLIQEKSCSKFTMNVKMKPGAVLVRVGGPVEEDHLAFVPALIRFANIRYIK